MIFDEQMIVHEIGDIQKLDGHTKNRNLLETLLKEEHKTKLSICAAERALDIATECIINFKKLNFFINKNVFDLVQLEFSRFMKLDFPVYKALDLLNWRVAASTSQNNQQQERTLLGCIDTCKTKMGHKTLRRWVSQPLAVQEQIEARLSVVEFLVNNTAVRNYVKNSFLAIIPDLEAISVKFFKIKTEIRSTAANLFDVVRVYKVVQHLETLCGFFKSYSIPDSDLQTVEQYFLTPIKVAIASLEKFQTYTEKMVDLARYERTHELHLRAGTSPELAELHAKLSDAESRMETERLRVETLLGYPVSLDNTSKGQVVFLTSKKAASVLGKSPSLTIKTVRAHQLRFVSPTCNTLSEVLLSAQEELGQVQSEHSGRVLQVLSSYYPVLEDLAEVIGEVPVGSHTNHLYLISLQFVLKFYAAVEEVDAFVSLADFSSLPSRCRPSWNTGDRVVLIQSTHPILAQRSNSGEVVANDCIMERDQSSFAVVTGPNMGGKSTFLRQVALNIILAQIGCYVCAQAASIPVFTGMVARIGAGDIQSRGVSTWMAELLEVSCMLQFSSQNTFLLIDELGRGTSTAEGVGMTWALAEHILEKMDCFCLFATHFFEMTGLSQHFAQVKNYHVDFKLLDQKSTQNSVPAVTTNSSQQAKEAEYTDMQTRGIKLNYKVLPGATDSAFGIQILQMMNFPKCIIEFAHDKAIKTRLHNESKSKMKLEATDDNIALDDKIEAILLARKARLTQTASSQLSPQKRKGT